MADRPVQPSPPPAAPPARSPATAALRERSDLPAMGVLLLSCLALALPLFLLELARPDVTHADEARALAQCRLTWQRHHDPALGSPFSLDAWTPYYNGQPQFTAPPGLTWAQMTTVWLHQLVLGPPDTQRFILLGRLTAAFFGCLTVLGVFWAARGLSDNRTAVFAGLVCVANPCLAWMARLATVPIAHAALATLAIAAALWATRPLKLPPAVSRQALGWGLCGLFLTAAVFVAGPIAWLTIALPILLMIVLCPGRLGHLLGLVAALLIALVLMLPWTLYVFDREPSAWMLWFEPLIPQWHDRPAFFFEHLPTRLGLVVLLLLPWAIWLLGGLGQPFSPSSKGSRLRLFLGWVWFAPLALVLVSLPQGGDLAFLLPLQPAAAVLIGRTFGQYDELAEQGRYANTWRRLRWGHLALLLLAWSACPLLLTGQIPLPVAGLLSPMGWAVVLAMTVALLTGLFVTLRPMLQDHPGQTLVYWSLLTVVFMMMALFPLARGPAAVNPMQQQGPDLSRLVGHNMLYWYVDSAEQPVREEPNPDLLFYADRSIPAVARPQLTSLLQAQSTLYLLAYAPPEPWARVVAAFPDLDRTLYVCSGAATAPASSPASSPTPTDEPAATSAPAALP